MQNTPTYRKTNAMEITRIKFDKNTPIKLKKIKFGTAWPAVYLINNSHEIYIGQTTDASVRMIKHLANKERSNLKNVTIISDEKFNQSAISDLENFLIQHMAADQKFKLQNGNQGLKNHNYYQKEIYQEQFKKIWNELIKRNLANNCLGNIEATNLFKYSPYKTLAPEQYLIIDEMLKVLAKNIKNNQQSLFMVHGGPGTGKTILAIYLIKLLLQQNDEDQLKETEDQFQALKIPEQQLFKNLKIALVIPTSDFRSIIKKVFKQINGLNQTMVVSPHDIVKSDQEYDLIIVDEAHLLKQRVNLTQYKTFSDNNKKLNLGSDGTELDWILAKSKHQVLFYDKLQRIGPFNVPPEKFKKLQSRNNYYSYHLETQFRCMLGGQRYIDYIRKVFSNDPPKRKQIFKKYELKLFEDINDMITTIKEKNKECGLCRNVAGFAWKWKSKGKKLPVNLTNKDTNNIRKNNIYDIEIDGYKYIWNTKAINWVTSENAIEEIGCIHTIHGVDLNYTGVIVGNELKYDDIKKKIYVDRKNYYDVKGKNKTTEDELLEYIFNIYGTLCTRGSFGTYIYICDKKLRKHLKKYIDVIQKK